MGGGGGSNLSQGDLTGFGLWFRSLDHVLLFGFAFTAFIVPVYICFSHLQFKYITRPNGTLDRRTNLCLYVPRFHRQVLKLVSKCKWIFHLHNIHGLRVQIPIL